MPPLIQPIVDLLALAVQSVSLVFMAVTISVLIMRQLSWFTSFD